MTDKPDIDELAQTYINLWQRQMTSMMNDPEVSKWMTQATQNSLEASQEIGKVWSDVLSTPLNDQGVARKSNSAQHGTSGKTKKGDHGHDGAKQENGTAGATATAVASRSDDRRMDELERRIATLEQRLTALEAGPEKPGGRTRKKS